MDHSSWTRWHVLALTSVCREGSERGKQNIHRTPLTHRAMRASKQTVGKQQVMLILKMTAKVMVRCSSVPSVAVIKHSAQKERVCFILQAATHHWEKTQRELKQELEVETREKHCSLTQAPAQLASLHSPGPPSQGTVLPTVGWVLRPQWAIKAINPSETRPSVDPSDKDSSSPEIFFRSRLC